MLPYVPVYIYIYRGVEGARAVIAIDVYIYRCIYMCIYIYTRIMRVYTDIWEWRGYKDILENGVMGICRHNGFIFI